MTAKKLEAFMEIARKVDRNWPLLAFKDGHDDYGYEIDVTDQDDQPRTLLNHAEPEEEWAGDFTHDLIDAWNSLPEVAALLDSLAKERDEARERLQSILNMLESAESLRKWFDERAAGALSDVKPQEGEGL